MHLLQIFLPVHDNEDTAFPKKHYAGVRETLTEQFDGVTAYTRTPAEGVWKDKEGAARQDEMVILEVMVAKLDKGWWRKYKKQLEKAFRQKEIIIRVQKMKLLS